MTPAEGSAARVRRLIAEIAADRRALRARTDEIESYVRAGAGWRAQQKLESSHLQAELPWRESEHGTIKAANTEPRVPAQQPAEDVVVEVLVRR